MEATDLVREIERDAGYGYVQVRLRIQRGSGEIFETQLADLTFLDQTDTCPTCQHETQSRILVLKGWLP